MQQPLQPQLVKSVSEEEEEYDDDEEEMSQEEQLPDDGVDRRGIAYLLRYETMVRQQEAEDMATLAHIRPILEYARSGSSLGFAMPDRAAYPEVLEQRVTFAQLQQIVQDVEQKDESPPFATDRQLMLLLKTLTENKSKNGVVKNGQMSGKDNNNDSNSKSGVEEDSMTWAEFIQCYKVVVGGMQTLEHLVSKEHRLRTRNRTMSMLSTFDQPSNNNNENNNGTPAATITDKNGATQNTALTKALRGFSAPALFSPIPFGKGTQKKQQQQQQRRRLHMAGICVVALATMGTMVFANDYYTRTEPVAPSLTVTEPIHEEQPTLAPIEREEPVVMNPTVDPPHKTDKGLMKSTYTKMLSRSAICVPEDEAIVPDSLPAAVTVVRETKPKVPLSAQRDPHVALQTLLEDHPMLSQHRYFHNKKRTRIAAAVGGSAGIVAAPVIWRIVPAVRALFSFLPPVGAGLVAVTTIGSVVYAVARGIRAFLRLENESPTREQDTVMM